MLTVKELSTNEIPKLADYWYSATKDELRLMGVVPEKMKPRAELEKMLNEQVNLPYHLKSTYCIVWIVDGIPVGHCNVNRIMFKDEANMHLHMWDRTKRKKGLGVEMIRLALPLFFKNLELQKIYCEPNAYNEAPNKALLKAGFHFIKMLRGKPGDFSDEQDLNQYVITKEEFETSNAKNTV